MPLQAPNLIVNTNTFSNTEVDTGNGRIDFLLEVKTKNSSEFLGFDERLETNEDGFVLNPVHAFCVSNTLD